MSVSEVSISLEVARQLLEEERQAREKRCLESLQELLKEHSCTLTVYLNRTSDGVFVPTIGVSVC